MLSEIISLNRKISKMPRPLKGLELFSNGYYLLTTDDRYDGTDEDSVDFKTLCSDKHIVMKNVSHMMVGAYRIGETNSLMVTTCNNQMFSREIWTFDGRQLFEGTFACQYEYDLDKGFSKIGFDSLDEKFFIVGDLKSGEIIESVPMKDAKDTVKKHGLNIYVNLFQPKISWKKVRPDSYQKPRIQMENAVKQIYPCAITASNQGYFCAVDNNLFYYFDLNKLDVLSKELKSFKPAKKDYLGRYYTENYSKILGLIERNKHIVHPYGNTRK